MLVFLATIPPATEVGMPMTTLCYQEMSGDIHTVVEKAAVVIEGQAVRFENSRH
jgi:hypothetical protein